MNPFGQTISSDDVLETLGFFDTWEERYKYIIDLGKEIPPLDEHYKTEEFLVKGCQSQVWLVPITEKQQLVFDVDSDAFIVKGLLGVVLSALNYKTPDEILAFDMEKYFKQLGLLKHLSMSRSNGLHAMVERIRSVATAQQSA